MQTPGDLSAQLVIVEDLANDIKTDLSNGVDGLGALSADIGVAQSDLDIITGASGVNLLTATQASIDAIETDLGNTTDGLGALKTLIDSVIVGTITNATGDDVATDVVALKVVADAVQVITDALTAAGAAKLALSTAGIIGGTTSGTPSTTTSNTDLTGYADNELIGRTIIFTGATGDGQATVITDYASTGGVVTYTAITTAPAASDAFVIV